MNACARTPSSPLELLVGDLSRQAKTLADYFQSNGLPEPSFQRDAPIDVLSPEAPKEIQAVRDQLMDHALQLFQLVAGPRECLENVQTNYQYMEALRWLNYFHIFELVPLEGNISYAELAGKAAVSELRLKSIARMAMTNHLFVEPVPGFLAHSATSAALTVDQQLVDQREWQGRVLAPTIASMVTAHKK
ncbi:O-methyltransferase [Grosmannia clavigera kw1407]|uniref:O-methyltransferase n=1 Tax=Grosmannia clavigera (strain kw1407 / UAMH 11150) TaxID=655863 RepID=F0XNS6_GROCL|nr:O-methyltransferase [Grosmannia clavigera kw1407]EFX00259.1 O-methyltransferase [Grosmannia clavigera kw1407]